MKKIILGLIGLTFCVTSFAQAPKKMSYQSIIRDSNGILVKEKLIGVKISVLMESSTGQIVFSEIHSVQSNANGIVSFAIGEGIPQIGSFANINWSLGPYYIKTDTDPFGGTNYIITGISELLSVPYALYSENGGTKGDAGNTGPQGMTGEKGTIGETGASGAQGTTGNTGASGAQGTTGNTGASGAQGTTGDTGASGAQGTTGDTGASGAQGTTGNTGASGAQGTTGNTGASGAQGTTGNTGASGAQGTTGNTGASGAQGTTGDTGASGAQGIKGDTGASGAQGTTGNTGASGAQGTTGNTGASGAQGTTGDTGASGAQGTTGNTGASGAQGTTGNTGASGAQGTTGDTGASGAQGTTGNTGASGAQGTTGDTGASGAQGIKGDTGASGAQGTTGNTGASGAQGTTGNTGASGAQGTTGDTGASGAQGTTGNTGASGAQGTTGNTGASGAQGTTGDTGASGAQGTTGNTGASGAQGTTGNTGASGAQGTTGDTGASGAQGTTGNTGASGAQGTTGNTGASGAQGTTGNTGASGAQGTTGDTGASGAQGTTGNTGASGPQGTTGNTGASGAQGIKGDTGSITSLTNSHILVGNSSNVPTDVALIGDATILNTGQIKVAKINGTELSTLSTGLLLNTTGTGIPSIAISSDFPLLNQNTSGTAANVTGIILPINGGTGKANNSLSTLELTGAFPTIITLTDTTTITLPTTGKLFGTATSSISSAQLSTSLTNETGTGSSVFSESPTFSGVPLAPTAAIGTNTTQIATTAFVLANSTGTYNSVNASAEITTKSNTDTVATSMTITPGAGTYAVTFNGNYESSSAGTTANCAADITKVYNQLIATTPNVSHIPGFGAGETLIPGVYETVGAGSISGSLTLNAAGDSNALFVFKINGALTTAAGTIVTLIGDAKARNVFWVATSAGAMSIAANCTIKGTLLAKDAAATIGNASSLEGRLLSNSGAITTGPSSISTPIGSSSINLGELNAFAIFTSSGDISNTGSSTINGNIGTNLGTITGFGTFNGSTFTPVVNGAALATFSIYHNGVLIPNSSRTRTTDINTVDVTLNAIATVAAGQAIDIRWKTSLGTLKLKNRILTAIKIQ